MQRLNYNRGRHLDLLFELPRRVVQDIRRQVQLT